MKIAILGGGFTGLTAAYYLQKKGHTVHIIEKEAVLGGLAAGFHAKGWNWPLERVYHHLFTNDTDIIGFAQETGFTGLMPIFPETSSLYHTKNGLQSFKLDSPVDLLRFPLLSLVERLRAGIVLGFLKFSPFLKWYESASAASFLKKYMGTQAWNQLFAEMFRKKFGKYAEKVLTSFFWARITKRTKNLFYIKGGFQTFIDHLEKTLTEQGINIKTGVAVTDVREKDGKYAVKMIAGRNAGAEAGNIVEVGQQKEEAFDAVICTLPTPIIPRITTALFPKNYLEQLKTISYLGAINLIIESTEPVLEQTYWLSILAKEIPIMVLVQHTNAVDREHYGGKHLLYIGNYLEMTDPLFKKTDQELLALYAPYLEQLKPGFTKTITRTFAFKAPFAQPIYDKPFLKAVPTFTTPSKNFFIANLDMTYPYDRGTNYAVKLGKDVSDLL
jgi:protoporphyrinogen oxidase